MAVSKKQPAKKRQKKKSSLWIIALIAVILLILVGVVFLVLPKFRKEAAPEKPETIKVEAAEKSYAAGSRISEKNFRVYGISGKKKQIVKFQKNLQQKRKRKLLVKMRRKRPIRRRK